MQKRIRKNFKRELIKAKLDRVQREMREKAAAAPKLTPFGVTCQHCQGETPLTDKQIRSLNAKLNNSLRKGPPGPPIKCRHPMTDEEMGKCKRCKDRAYMRARRAGEIKNQEEDET